MTAYTDGEWWVGGFLLDEEGKRVFRLIEQVDKETEDPAQRMNYWRNFPVGLHSREPYATRVQLVEISVRNFRPRGWTTTDHRLLITEDEGAVEWECRCGQSSGRIPFGEQQMAKTVQEARQGAAWSHDTHLIQKVPDLRCARCGERSHSIEYCERDA